MTTDQLHELFLQSNGISTDTRKLESNTIFFALKGDNFNGNEFAEKAIEEGCSYAVVDEEAYSNNEKCILVDDVLKCLQDLANYHRKQFDIPVIGITGSNGKTTTKELLAAVLEKKYKTLVTEGNLNNHLGVPFTILKLTSEHQIAVIEMGASKVGDIKELAEIAEPTHGIITNIGSAHLEGFGSFENVLKTKTELYRFIDRTYGTLFFNVDDEILMSELPKVKAHSFGETSAEVTGKLEDLTPYVCFSWQFEKYESPLIQTKLIGRYNMSNFLAAVCIGNHFGVPTAAINSALENYVPSNNRSQIQKTNRNTLIVDCYNANVTSMNAALESLVQTDHPNKMVILGDMLELGDSSTAEHQNTVNYLEAKGLKAILVGGEFLKTESQYPTYLSYEEVVQNEKLPSIEGNLILLKGSRGIKLENLIEHL